MSKYDDIINLNRPKSKYPKMSKIDRAAQFASFAALTGHSEAIKETARLTDKKKILSDEEKNDIDLKLKYINNNINNNIIITITYFIKDKYKEGGSYNSIKGEVKKIDLNKKIIIFKDNKKVLISTITSIEI